MENCNNGYENNQRGFYDLKANILYQIENRRELLPVIAKSIYGEPVFHSIFNLIEDVMNNKLEGKDTYSSNLVEHLRWFCFEYSLYLKTRGVKEEDLSLIDDLSELIVNYRNLNGARELDGLEHELQYNLIIPEYKRLIQASAILSEKMEALTNRTTPMQEMSIALSEAVMDRYQMIEDRTVEYKNIIKEKEKGNPERLKNLTGAEVRDKAVGTEVPDKPIKKCEK